MKRVDPDLEVGGPATCPASPDWVLDHVNHGIEHEIPIDFASTHLFMISHPKTEGEFFQSDLYRPQNRLEQARRIRGYLEASKKPDMPLHITEWNPSYSPLGLMHGTTMNAAYVAWVIAHMDGIFDSYSYSYWTFCDVFEENGVSSAPFHGGLGLVSRRDDGRIAALLFNPCLSDECAQRSSTAGTAGIVSEGTGSEGGRGASRESRDPVAEDADAAGGRSGASVTVEVVVPPNGIALVLLSEREDMTADYRGLPEREWGVRT